MEKRHNLVIFWTVIDYVGDGKGKTVKKEQLTKSQKRRMWDKGGTEDERDRGWDWIDVVK